MTNLLVLKERLKDFYSKNEVFITPALKFLLAFVSLLTINGKLGYMTKATNIFVVLVVALMCSFLPINFIIIIAAGFVLLHLYALTIECAIVGVGLFLLLFLLYFRFTPKDTLVVLLLPIMFILKVPYVVPVAMGLIGTPIAIISVGCGTIVYYLIEHVSSNANVLSAMEAESAIQKFRFVIDGILGNKAMFVTIAAFSFTVIVVYMVRRMSVDHAWTIAILTGLLLNVMVLFIGDLIFDTQISLLATIAGSAVSFGLAKLLQFFAFNVDYSRVENVQFEDDEYYYYVKAVPKITLSTPEKKVKRINSQKRVSSARPQ